MQNKLLRAMVTPSIMLTHVRYCVLNADSPSKPSELS